MLTAQQVNREVQVEDQMSVVKAEGSLGSTNPPESVDADPSVYVGINSDLRDSSTLHATTGHDEKEQLAALALENLRTQARIHHDPLHAVSSTGPYPNPPHLSPNAMRHQPSASSMPTSMHVPPSQAPRNQFIKRVSSSIPLLNKSIGSISSAYQATKAASPNILKYTVESVEVGMRAVTQPVLGHLPALPSSIDRFACKQLDKLEATFPYILHSTKSPSSHDPKSYSLLSSNTRKEAESCSSNTLYVKNQQSDGPVETRQRIRLLDILNEDTTTSALVSPPITPNTVPSIRVQTSASIHSPSPTILSSVSRAVSTVSANVGSVSSNFVNIVSYESWIAFKYCLDWLQYANNRIENAIRQMIGALQIPLAINHSQTIGGRVTTNQNAWVGRLKREIVDTLRRVLDVVGHYAALCLSREAKINIRKLFLSLPGRWAATSSDKNGESDSSSVTSVSSETERVLQLARETSGMLSQMQSIFLVHAQGARVPVISGHGHVTIPMGGTLGTDSNEMNVDDDAIRMSVTSSPHQDNMLIDDHELGTIRLSDGISLD